MKWPLNKYRDTGEKDMTYFHLLSQAINHRVLACLTGAVLAELEAQSAGSGERTWGVCIWSVEFLWFLIALCPCAQRWAVIFSVIPVNDLSGWHITWLEGCLWSVPIKSFESPHVFLSCLSPVCVCMYIVTQTQMGSWRGTQHVGCDGYFASVFITPVQCCNKALVWGLEGFRSGSGFYAFMALGKLFSLLPLIFLDCTIRCLIIQSLGAFHNSKNSSSQSYWPLLIRGRG